MIYELLLELVLKSISYRKFQTIEDVNKAVFKYNYGFYNTKRIHQSLDYLTPNQVESKYIELN